MRVIIYNGKGGVGKTSVAAATAIRSAEMGHRTLIMSTDSAHSLSDSLEFQLSGTIVNVMENLDAIEVDILHEMETRWNEIEGFMTDFLSSQGFEGITAKEFAIMPGMELLSALFYLWDVKEKDLYDVVVVDTAPTAETLRLLSFPDISDWYFERLYKYAKRLISVARVTVGKVMDVPLPSQKVLKDIDEIRDRIGLIREILMDPEVTTIRLVVNPERMVINETKRAYTYLCLYGMTVEGLVINRVIPESESEYFKEKLEEQTEYMQLIEESFSPLPVMRAYLLPTELVGMDKLRGMADMLFGDDDPTKHYSESSPMRMYSEGDVDVMSLRVPFSERGDIDLFKSTDVLIIQIGQYKRSVVLPYSLARAKRMRAEFVDGELLIRFYRGEGDD